MSTQRQNRLTVRAGMPGAVLLDHHLLRDLPGRIRAECARRAVEARTERGIAHQLGAHPGGDGDKESRNRPPRRSIDGHSGS